MAQSSILRFFNKTPNKTAIKTNSKETNSPSVSTKISNPDTTYNLYDIVWAKLEGHPWWPSIICYSPGKRKDKYFFNGKYHVQFIDEPPSRAWIKHHCIKAYEGKSKGPIKFSPDSKWNEACNEADVVMLKSKSDVMKIVCTFSDSEDSDDDSDKSKENLSHNSSTKKRKIQCNNSSLKKKKLNLDVPEEVSNSESADSDEEDFQPLGNSSDSESVSSGAPDETISDVDDSEPEETPKKKPKTIKKGTTNMKAKSDINAKLMNCQASLSPGSVSSATKSKLSAFSCDESVLEKSVVVEEGQFAHLKLDFLKPDKLCDANRKSLNDPEYDPHTLYVPESFMKTVTPAMYQWWELKSKNFDVVLFFKVGKFYELYHMDAVIGVRELGLIFMKGEVAHSGFPEISYSRFADILVQRGYKVARVEQTETPEMMAERCKQSFKSTKFDKVVKREICRITSKATKMNTVLEAEVGTDSSVFLMSVVEKPSEKASNLSEFGVCFIDTSIGQFNLGQFEDDRHYSRLRTLLSHYPPAQIISERNGLSPVVEKLLSSDCYQREIIPSKNVSDPCLVLKKLLEGNYFDEKCEESDTPSSKIQFPQTIQEMLDPCDNLGLTPKTEYSLAIKALGGVMWYLSLCLIEHDLLSMKNFKTYHPLDRSVSKKTSHHKPSPKHLVLDDTTLRNLEIIPTSLTNPEEGTLFEQLDHCSTPFGKRLLSEWICQPLCDIEIINNRLDAIENLMQCNDKLSDLTKLMRQLPDLPRCLSNIHVQGSEVHNNEHPDSRAIFYEAALMSKRKINSFLATLDGFKIAVRIQQRLEELDIKSPLLKDLCTLEENGGKFPSLIMLLNYFDTAFNHEQAKKDGKMIPAPGVVPEYDNAMRKLKEIDQELNDYLKQQCQYFGEKITYFSTGKNKFQLEVPDRCIKRANEKYELQSQRKGFKRYWTSEIKVLLSKHNVAQDAKENILKDITRRIFEQFDKSFKEWSRAVDCLSILDVLTSLTLFSNSWNGSMCRPHLKVSQQSYLQMEEGRHPCLLRNENLIPNSLAMGQTGQQLLLLTGANMGGKSTLMRQTGLLIVLAQIGCYVPAESFLLSPFHRIFTRLGARDNIMLGESTFFIELSETAAILRHADSNSLVLMDELGRGTATYDGTAIAAAVASKLVQLGCLTIFSTHYHTLVQDYEKFQGVKLAHMACMVENENEDDPTEETITFLYKLSEGSCPKSYGFNAAKLAGLPTEVIQKAYSKAKQLETSHRQLHKFIKLYKSSCIRDIKKTMTLFV